MVQRHPVQSFDKTLNFWEEFPDFKVHRMFREFWSNNKRANKLKESSLFMWALALCYDRASAFYAQPEPDRWEVVSEDLFEDPNFMSNLVDDPDSSGLIFTLAGSPFALINAFEEAIDTPLGLSLRQLERKLAERTAFIMSVEYTLDSFEDKGGRQVLVKGTADQLDKMLTNSGKLNDQIKKAMDELKMAGDGGSSKGGGESSLSDKDTGF